MAKFTEKTSKVFAYLQANDNGNGVAISEIAAATGFEEKSVRPIVVLSLAAKKDGSRGALASYEKRKIEGVEKEVGYAVLTDEGRSYVDAE